MSGRFPLSLDRSIERQWAECTKSLRQIRGQIVVATERTLQRVFSNKDSLIPIPTPAGRGKTHGRCLRAAALRRLIGSVDASGGCPVF